MSATQDALTLLADRIRKDGIEIFTTHGNLRSETRDALEWFANELSVSQLALGDERAHFICICPDCVRPVAPVCVVHGLAHPCEDCAKELQLEETQAFHLNSDKTAAVGDHEFYDMDNCPRNVKVILLNPGGVAIVGVFDGDPQWLGWFPVPKKRKKT